jgi:hypothetical protein
LNCRDHIDAFDTAFADAVAARPDDVGEATCVFGGRSLRVRTVGTVLTSSIRRPFLRDSTDRAHVELRLDLWDGTSNAAPPMIDDPGDLEEGRGENGELVAVSSDGTSVRFSSEDLVLWLDRPARRIVGWARAVEHLSPWHRYRPLQALLSYWLAGSGVRVIHASAVARGEVGALVVGRNGVGKSTCAMAALSAGLEILGDDVVAVDTASRTIHTLYTVVKMRRPPQVIDGSIAVMAAPNGDPEWVTFLNEAAPDQLRPRCSVAALVFPRLASRAASEVTSIRQTDALKGLLLTDQMGNADSFDASLQQWGGLLAEVPAYGLEVGRDPDSLGTTIAGLIENASR